MIFGRFCSLAAIFITGVSQKMPPLIVINYIYHYLKNMYYMYYIEILRIASANTLDMLDVLNLTNTLLENILIYLVIPKII